MPAMPAKRHRPNPPEGIGVGEYVARCRDCGDWITKAERWAGSDGKPRTYWQHVGNRAADIRSGRRDRF